MKKAFSLAEIMMAVMIFFMGIVGVYYLFSQGSVGLAKGSYVTLATTIAKGEVDRIKTSEFYLIKNENFEGGKWDKIEAGDSIYGLIDFPKDYLDRFEKKIEIADIIDKRLKKVIVSVRWNEIVKGQEKWRQLNFPTFVSNSRVYIYF
ncbi:MAG: hypothetical protein WDA74_11495 [Spirochaetota bacterium]